MQYLETILQRFGIINIFILVLFLAGVTYLAHRLAGATLTRRSFFLGDRDLPWWAVSASIVATKTSAVSFVAVPAAVFMAGGNLTYVQVLIGIIIGKVLMALIFIKSFYEKEIYSPYDYMDARIDPQAGNFARILFAVEAALSQGVRLLTTGLVLSVITGLPTWTSIVVIAVFAVVWSLLGGIKTVVWTDGIQFCIFTMGAFFAAFWVYGSVDMPLGEMIAFLDEQAKLRLIDLSLDPKKAFTLWTAFVGVAVFELSNISVNQVVTQRLLCCRTARDAQKACVTAGIISLSPFLMLGVGLALSIFYHVNPLPAEMVEALKDEPDRIFPYFIVTQIPDGVSGLLIASIFAAGISTLDSGVTALSQVSTTSIYEKYIVKNADDPHYLFVSKVSIFVWAGLLAGVAIWLSFFQAQGLLRLAYLVPAYVNGILLGMVFMALRRRGSWRGLVAGVIVSLVAMAFLKSAEVNFFWWYPITALTTYFGSQIPIESFANRSERDGQ